jgi:hypothetical protein
MSKAGKAITIFWLFLTVVCLLTAVHAYINIGAAQGNLFCLLSVLSFLMFVLRKRLQRKQDSEK